MKKLLLAVSVCSLLLLVCAAPAGAAALETAATGAFSWSPSPHAILADSSFTRTICTGPSGTIYVASNQFGTSPYGPSGIALDRVSAANGSVVKSGLYAPAGMLLIIDAFINDGHGNLVTTCEEDSPSRDMWVIKFSPAFKVIWKRKYTGGQQAFGLTRDRDGDIFVGTTVPSTGHALGDAYDSAVIKYSPGGHLRWARFVRTSSMDLVTTVACDRAGDVYASGSSHVKGYTMDQGVVVSYSPGGALRWKKTTTSAKGAQLTYLVVHGTSVCTAGDEGYPATWLAGRYSLTGKRLMWKTLTPGDGGWVDGMKVDGAGDMIVAGYQSGTPPAAAAETGFLWKLKSTGHTAWARPFVNSLDPTFETEFDGLAIDSTGRVYVGGYFATTADASQTDGLVVRYTSAGVADKVWRDAGPTAGYAYLDYMLRVSDQAIIAGGGCQAADGGHVWLARLKP